MSTKTIKHGFIVRHFKDYESYVAQSRHDSAFFLNSSNQHFLSGYQYIAKTGRNVVEQYLNLAFGSAITAISNSIIAKVLQRLQLTYYNATFQQKFHFSDQDVNDFFSDLYLFLDLKWPIIRSWTFSELFSFLQTCCRDFHTTYKLELDFFNTHKRYQHNFCLAAYHLLRDQQQTDPLPFSHLCYLVVRSNWIDSMTQVEFKFLERFKDEINDVLDRAQWVDELVNQPPYFNYRSLLYDVSGAKKTILYECDNHGELLFDLLFIEQLLLNGHKVIMSTKAYPVLNDVTYADLIQLLKTNDFKHFAHYLASSALRLINNGSGDAIVLRYQLSLDYQQAYKACDFVILKGQGNFESFPMKLMSYVWPKRTGYKKPHYYLFGLKSMFTCSSFKMLDSKIKLETPVCLYFA